MKTIVILAMHGSPPKDVSTIHVVLNVSLHMAIEHGPSWLGRILGRPYARLDTRIRTWTRTEENDPFHAASEALAAELFEATGHEVLVGYNEFCAPTLDEVLDLAVSRGADRIVVVTPMMTRGGEHSEEDIPTAVGDARTRHPTVEFAYAWPFEPAAVARFLGEHLRRSSDT